MNKELENMVADIKENEKELESADSQMRQLDKQIKENREEKELVDIREKLTEENRVLSAKLIETKDNIKTNLEMSYYILSHSITREAKEFVEEKRVKGEIPSPIRRTFIEDLIKIGVCICGHGINEKEKKILMKRVDEVPPSGLEDVLMGLQGRIDVLDESVGHKVEDLRKLLKDEDGCEKRQHDILRELNGISTQLKGGGGIGSKLEAKRSEWEDKVVSLRVKNLRLEEKKVEHTKAMNEKQKKCEKLEKSTKRHERISDSAQLATKSSEALEGIIEEFSEVVRKQIEKKTIEIFKEFMYKEEFVKVVIDENYRIELFDKTGLPVKAGLSQGERQSFSLAFIISMAQITGIEAPFVMDTPLGRIDNPVRSSICETMPQNLEQVILFATGVELPKRSEERKAISDSIGIEYNLVRNTDLGFSEIKRV